MQCQRRTSECGSAGFTYNTVRGAEDLATKKFSLVTKWTVPTTFSWVFSTTSMCVYTPPPPFFLFVEEYIVTQMLPLSVTAQGTLLHFLWWCPPRCLWRPHQSRWGPEVPQEAELLRNWRRERELQPTFLSMLVSVKACFILVPSQRERDSRAQHKDKSTQAILVPVMKNFYLYFVMPWFQYRIKAATGGAIAVKWRR